MLIEFHFYQNDSWDLVHIQNTKGFLNWLDLKYGLKPVENIGIKENRNFPLVSKEGNSDCFYLASPRNRFIVIEDVEKVKAIILEFAELMNYEVKVNQMTRRIKYT